MFCIHPGFAALMVAFTLGQATATSGAAAAERDYANPQLLTTVGDLVEVQEREVMFTTMGGISDLRIVDVRKEEAFAQGHLPGAINIPFTRLTDEHAAVAGALKSDAALAEMLGAYGIRQKSEIVLYDDQGGFRAARLFWLLEYFGHRKVSLLDGGLQAWTRAGHKLVEPLKTASGKPLAKTEWQADWQPAVFAVTRTPRRYASADYILERRDDSDTVVVDVRPAKFYQKGHIPWARNLPWQRNLAEDLTMKPAGVLLAQFAEEGITRERNVVIHCQNGEASAHSYFALRLLGYPRVRTYHRSWAEWGLSDDLPKAAEPQG